MRIESLLVRKRAPTSYFEVRDLSTIVVIAGPNGVGKTRILQQALSLFQSPHAHVDLRASVVASTQEEVAAWGRDRLDTGDGQQAMALRQTLQRNLKRGKWKSNVVYFDSSRQFERIQPLQWSWDFRNPLEEDVSWNMLFGSLRDRFNDTIHSILKRLAHHRNMIAERAIEMQRQGTAQMPLDFPDPLAKYKEAFSLLLGPKKLVDVDIKDANIASNPQLKYELNGQVLNFDTLSSGEREVVGIAFDLLLREPEDCIIIFDEPELHLHPELSFRLLKTLQTIGQRNQFVMSTHSADIIMATLDHSVVFVSPPRPDGSNQAIQVRPDDENATALRLLGQNLGVISLGRRIIVIEGNHASLDLQAYGEIVGKKFPGFVLSPSGARQNMVGFSHIVERILSKTVWGIDFYMLADRDADLPERVLSDLEKKAGGRLRFLPRYHLENYFLDVPTIVEAFRPMEKPDSWLLDAARVSARLQSIATETIPYAIQLWIGARLRAEFGELDVSVKGIDRMTRDEFLVALGVTANSEMRRLAPILDVASVQELAKDRWNEIEEMIRRDDPRWKSEMPGRTIVNKFASAAGVDAGRFKTLYLSQARKQEFAPFDEVIQLFHDFDALRAS